MTKSHLCACPACDRHVRVSEAACPFCGSALSDAFRTAPVPQPPGVRLTRAALFAFGAGSLGFAPGCTSTTTPEPLYGAPPYTDSGSNDAADDGPIGIVDAAYGGPPIDAPAPLYGAPPGDAGPDTGADAGGNDAATDAPIGMAAYGGPPIDAGTD
jgi:hypothetical protein